MFAYPELDFLDKESNNMLFKLLNEVVGRFSLYLLAKPISPLTQFEAVFELVAENKSVLKLGLKPNQTAYSVLGSAEKVLVTGVFCKQAWLTLDSALNVLLLLSLNWAVDYFCLIECEYMEQVAEQLYVDLESHCMTLSEADLIKYLIHW